MDSIAAAIKAQNLDHVSQWLSSSPPPSQTSLDKALTLACDTELGFLDAVEPILKRGAKVTESAFMDALHRDDVTLFEAFVKYGWDVNTLEFGQPALRLAVGRAETVKWLLEHGANPNLRGQKVKASPLATAALEESPFEVMDLLRLHGAEMDPDALMKAMNPRGRGGLPVMQYLIDHGIDMNVPTSKWGTPLHYAVAIGNISKLRLLLDSGADKTIQDSKGKTPAELAAEKGLQGKLEMLSE